MKTKIFLLVSFVLITVTLKSFNFFQSSTGPHGGSVKQAAEYNIEMKRSYSTFYVYLLDKKLKPISNKGISCEIKFSFPDNTSITNPLKAFGEEGFSMESGTLKFYSCRVYFNVYGKSVSAAFENENPIVEKR